ncbi:TerC family protein [Rhodopseudomonas palustris]|uniref:TerC family protein n=1 Tax=Rhodopseudomonas palustris TaxID=1076 RepID=UPI00115E6763|nr:TerC family protein [Rhodopseudomonas palustris]QDL97747.1 TerC family protein [Rhodopseudomonas palustris]
MDWVLHVFDPATFWSIVAQFKSDVQQPEFWISVGKIIWINVLLSGDNALVIALACRGLKPHHRLWGMVLGAAAAVMLRIIFTGIVATLMEWPYLKLVGGLALLVIAAKLVVPDNEDEDSVRAASHLLHAVQIVVVADIIMSLDNVIAVAAAADGNVVLLILGLTISVPLIVAGAALILMVLEKLPVLVWAGAALLGWIAGQVIATDAAALPFVHKLDAPIGTQLDALFGMMGMYTHLAGNGTVGEHLFAVSGAVVVLIAGSIWRSRQSAAQSA